MSTFSTRIRINAPKERVWEVLAEVGDIYKWNPGVSHSYSTSESSRGEGVTRHCDLQSFGRNVGYLEERAIDWCEGEGFKIDIYKSNLPIKRNLVAFSIEADDDTSVVTVSPDYEIKYGPIGRLIDWLVARRQMKKGMDGLLAGLKYYVETGKEVGDKVPDLSAAA